MTWGMDDDDARLDAAIERDRERKLELFRHHGPEYWEDWMGYCERCQQEECTCETCIECGDTFHAEDLGDLAGEQVCSDCANEMIALAAQQVDEFLNARDTMLGHDRDRVYSVWTDGEERVLWTKDLRILVHVIREKIE